MLWIYYITIRNPVPLAPKGKSCARSDILSRPYTWTMPEWEGSCSAWGMLLSGLGPRIMEPGCHECLESLGSKFTVVIHFSWVPRQISVSSQDNCNPDEWKLDSPPLQPDQNNKSKSLGTCFKWSYYHLKGLMHRLSFPSKIKCLLPISTLQRNSQPFHLMTPIRSFKKGFCQHWGPRTGGFSWYLRVGFLTYERGFD